VLCSNSGAGSIWVANVVTTYCHRERWYCVVCGSHLRAYVGKRNHGYKVVLQNTYLQEVSSSSSTPAKSFKMRFLATITALLLAPTAVFAAWGYTDDGKNYVIDTNANLVVKVSKTNGDMTSIKYRGIEYNGQNGKNSHVESGLAPGTVTIKQYTTPANIIKVTMKVGTLVHTLIFRYGNANVYIFMNKKDSSITVSRYILRIPPNIFTNNINEDTDWIPDGANAIESGDINGLNGQTWSKHYSGKKYGRTMDYDYVGYTNNNVGMYMIRSNHEKASGGPFFRSLLRRGGGGPDLYDIYHYNMGA
jgi:rhamnogalacturonan endolyase